jgi:hypothetical protein
LLVGMPLQAMAVTERVEIAPFIPIKSDQSRPLAEDISSVMRHIALARKDLRQQDPAKAKLALQQSLTTLGKLEKQFGSDTLSLWISAKHDTLNADSRDAYQEANMRDFRRLDTAKAELNKGELTSAEQTVGKVDFPLAYAEMDVPLRQLRDAVANTLALIQQGKTAAAEQTLEQAQLAAHTDASLFGGDFRA